MTVEVHQFIEPLQSKKQTNNKQTNTSTLVTGILVRTYFSRKITKLVTIFIRHTNIVHCIIKLKERYSSNKIITELDGEIKKVALKFS